MRIGNVSLSNNLFLAPLAGVTINAFRLLCKDYGAGLCYAPIMNENAVINNAREVIDVLEEERPIAGQLIGNDALKLSKAAVLLEPFVDVIDFNLGCSRRKEVECGVGSVLLMKPDKIRRLVTKLVDSVSVPVTCKIRLGFKDVNVLEIVKIIESAGAKAVTIHARLGVQDYDVPADYSWIKKAKDAVSIPVIGNGDLFSPLDVKRMLDVTGCDAVMIARGANGYPFIFRDSLKYLETGVLPPMPSSAEKLEAFMKFYEYYGLYVKKPSIHDLRMHASMFVKGVKNYKSLRHDLMNCASEKEIIKVMNSLT